MSNGKLFIGLLVAPVGAVLTFLFLVDMPFGGAVMWVALFAYPAEILLAFPGHLMLRHLQISSWFMYGLLGVVVGAVPFIALAGLGMPDFLSLLGIGVLCGLNSALIFWFVVVRLRFAEDDDVR